MKKYLILLILVFTMILTSCNEKTNNDTKKLKIMTTLFPQYDFTRQIVKDLADVELLLTPGMESHSYDLTPTDVIKILKSDLFIYTGENMETWVQTVIDSLDNSKVVILDVSKNIELFEINHLEDHDHENDFVHHEHEVDPHIWTSPKNAKIMVENILESIVKIDPDNKEYYEKNAADYLKELDTLDKKIEKIVSTGKRNKLYFGSRFAFYYFVRDYKLEHVSAYDSCADEAEPSLKVVTDMINEIKKENIPVIYYQELTGKGISSTISSETNAKQLLFHSAHNVSKK